ncbi:MAG: hypothetical protein HY482_00905 [Candidatus Wildermuthbacteria bacterium]|nr:hypothetical protein [Candidatus Wildermuthbacteria bacterium]
MIAEWTVLGPSPHKYREVIVIPHVGDRKLVISIGGEAHWGLGLAADPEFWVATADYTNRPSIGAAGPLMDLTQNPPLGVEWREWESQTRQVQWHLPGSEERIKEVARMVS